MPPEEKIKLDEAELEKFYTEIGSRHFGLQAEVAKTYGDAKLNIYFKLIEFTNQIVTVIGVVAGFGFTALSSVNSKIDFAIGEGFLFAGMLLGIFLVHTVYSGELLHLEEAQETHRKHFKERNDVFKKVWEDLNGDGADPADFEKLKALGEETLKLFAPKEERPSGIKNLKAYQRVLLYCLVAGCFLILFSIVVPRS